MAKLKKINKVLTSLMLGAAIILFWRGVWNLADMYLFPSNIVISAVASILIGVFILYLKEFNLKKLRP